MKKAIDQTVRDLKRGVNKSVLKVPVIEQKVLDATSNESWGPHGSILADIAQASRNYHEYHIIMPIIWKRINDTGKNWRHVYKALIVLEYLVGHGSERVIDDIREHAYQISALSDFQYIDSSGKDQGNNVRRKSQSLVVLVNDKERIQEVREKAAANKDKYRAPPTGGMYRPGSGGYGDRYNDDNYEGRYRNRDDGPNGYGRDRDWGSRDDRYGHYGDSSGRDGDRYGRDFEERYSRDSYRDDDYRGRGQSGNEYDYNSRSRSADRARDRTIEDDGHFPSRESGAGTSDHPQHERKSSGQNADAPPSYEDAVSAYSDRDGDSSQPNAPKEFSSPGASLGTVSTSNPSAQAAPAPAPKSSAPVSASTSTTSQTTIQHSYNNVDTFDEFDPRGSFSAAPATSGVPAPVASGVEMDLLALVPVDPPYTSPEANGSANFNPGPTFVTPASTTVNNQTFDDPFGDGPFRAGPTENSSIPPQITTPPNLAHANTSQSFEAPQPAPQKAAHEVGGTYFDTTYTQSDPSGAQPKPETSFPNQETDILADILPPAAPSFTNTQSSYPLQPSQSAPDLSISALTNQNVSHNSFHPQTGQPAGFPTQLNRTSSQPLYPASSIPLQSGQQSQMGFNPQSSNLPLNAHANFYGTHANPPSHPQLGSTVPMNTTNMTPQQAPLQSTSNPSSTGLAAKDKFEIKSGVWADTMSRGLVNLNISGPKTNPLADIGVDFNAINRREKRMEKPTTSTVTSTVTMGKAMGSGSGMGRAGAGALRAPPNMGMGGGPGAGIGMGGYGVRPPVGMSMQQQQAQQMGYRPGYPYNPMMGTGNYGQQPYGGYR